MKMIKRAIGVLLFLSLHSLVFAIDGLLVQTIDYAILDKWTKTDSAEIAGFSTVKTVVKNQYFYLYPAFWDFKLDQSGNADIAFSLTIKNPDGAEYFRAKDIKALKGKISNPEFVYLAGSGLYVCFEPEDLPGTYMIECTISDKIGKKEKAFKQTILLNELPAKMKTFSDSSLSEWIGKYYQSPDPQNFPAAFYFYCNSKMADKDSAYYPIMSFFLEIIKNNSYLVSGLEAKYKEQTPKARAYTIALLCYSKLASSQFLATFSEEEKTLYDKLQASGFPEPANKITQASDLDVLWGRFLASGSFTPVLLIINTLENSIYSGSLEKYKNSAKTEEDRLAAIKETIYQAAVWSIKSNCQQHELVRSYCIYILNNEDISDEVRKQLEVILN